MPPRTAKMATFPSSVCVSVYVYAYKNERSPCGTVIQRCHFASARAPTYVLTTYFAKSPRCTRTLFFNNDMRARQDTEWRHGD